MTDHTPNHRLDPDYAPDEDELAEQLLADIADRRAEQLAAQLPELERDRTKRHDARDELGEQLAETFRPLVERLETFLVEFALVLSRFARGRR